MYVALGCIISTRKGLLVSSLLKETGKIVVNDELVRMPYGDSRFVFQRSVPGKLKRTSREPQAG